MTTFSVGEIALGHGFQNWPEYNGVECIVLEGLRPLEALDQRSGEVLRAEFYLVKFSDGEIAEVLPINLRKRRPPSTDESHQAMLDCIERAKRGVEVEA